VADLAAAAVRADRRMEESDVIEHALSHLGGTASPRLEQLIARARGILADPGQAGAHFDRGLSVPAGDQWPFERAQLRVDYAEWRRRRRINDAKLVLTQALGTFRRLGARSWAQRTEAELRACGVAVGGAPGEPDALWELTPQQRQIVRLASDGLTNREIGDRLFLPRARSARTCTGPTPSSGSPTATSYATLSPAPARHPHTKAREARRFPRTGFGAQGLRWSTGRMAPGLGGCVACELSHDSKVPRGRRPTVSAS